MMILGAILLILGVVLALKLLLWLGVVLLVIGAVMVFVVHSGSASTGGRRRYWF